MSTRLRSTRRSLVRTLACAATIVATVLPLSAHAQLTCGGTIGPGGSFTMTSDILNCAESTALTVIGPVELDMNGHRVRCGGGLSTGVQILGKGAVVTRGYVEQCTICVSLGGDGRHRVRGLDTSLCALGFGITSDGNALATSAAHQHSTGGFQILGNQNKLTGNAALSTAEYGFSVSGDGNSFVQNSVSQAFKGFILDAMSAANKLKENRVTEAFYGYEVQGAQQTLLKNTYAARDAAGFVFSVGGDGGHLLKGNSVTGPLFTMGYGIIIFSDGNRVKNNRVMLLSAGINVAADANDNAITGNEGVVNSIDGRDENADCDNNVWKNNFFVRTGPSCVQ